MVPVQILRPVIQVHRPSKDPNEMHFSDVGVSLDHSGGTVIFGFNPKDLVKSRKKFSLTVNKNSIRNLINALEQAERRFREDQ